MTVVKKASGAFNLFSDHIGNHQVVEEGRAAVFDLVAERDPQMAGDGFGRGDLLPGTRPRLPEPMSGTRCC